MTVLLSLLDLILGTVGDPRVHEAAFPSFRPQPEPPYAPMLSRKLQTDRPGTRGESPPRQGGLGA